MVLLKQRKRVLSWLIQNMSLDMPNGEIVLMDEVHTCDSSRYWIKDTYEQLFSEGKEPEKYDKDIVRYWIKENIKEDTNNEYKIPESIKETASNAYLNFYERLTGNKIKVKRTFDLNDIDSNVWDSPDQKIREWATHFFPSCVLVSGSLKDNDHCQKIIDKLSDDIVSVYFS